jgi:hypothetical protein
MWGAVRLGNSTDTIRQSGCAITCLAMLSEMPPDEVNDLLLTKGGYIQGCLVAWDKASKILGLTYKANRKTPDASPTIAETRHYASKGVPQHFFLVFSDNTIIDPLDNMPRRKPNIYEIVGYRNIIKG